MRALVNGRVMPILFDLGATVSIISKDLAEKLNLPFHNQDTLILYGVNAPFDSPGQVKVTMAIG